MSQKGGHPLNGEDKKILIIGLGQIGYSNAEYMKKFGLRVDGYDTMEKAVQRALAAGVIQNQATNFKNYDHDIICISTHNPDNMFVPYLDGLSDIATKLAEERTPGALGGMDSTDSNGTEKQYKKCLRH